MACTIMEEWGPQQRLLLRCSCPQLVAMEQLKKDREAQLQDRRLRKALVSAGQESCFADGAARLAPVTRCWQPSRMRNKAQMCKATGAASV
jgi:hypothetical protein